MFILMSVMSMESWLDMQHVITVRVLYIHKDSAAVSCPCGWNQWVPAVDAAQTDIGG